MQVQNSTKTNERQAAVLERDPEGRARLIQVDGHRVNLHRLDGADLILIACYDGDGQPCAINSQGICAHGLAAIFEAAHDAGVCVTTCVREDAAEELAGRVGGKVLMARSEQTPAGQGRLWVIAGANGTPKDPDTVAREAGATHRDKLDPTKYWRSNGRGVEVGTIEAGRLTWRSDYRDRIPEWAAVI